MIARATGKRATATPPEKDESLCIVPDCTRQALGPRGLCNSCYGYARKTVLAKETTWEQLEKLKLARPPHASPRSPFVIAFTAARMRAKSKLK